LLEILFAAGVLNMPAIPAISKRGPLLSRRDVIGPPRSFIAPPAREEMSREKELEMLRSVVEGYKKVVLKK
jgi:hypothetical protein